MSQPRRLQPVRAAQALLVVFTLIGTATVASAQPRRPQPAPVPDAVVMPRPTADEVEAARRGFAEFLRTTDPATRALVERYPGLLEVRVPGPNTAIIPNLAQNFRVKHEQNLEVAKAGDVELLLMGDSITDFWRQPEGRFAGKPILDEYFGQWKIANFGIAGDTTQGVIYRLQNGEGEGFTPRAIMLMIGTNNTAANSAPEIAEGVGAIVLDMRTRWPDAQILLLAVFPRGTASDPRRQIIAGINERIAKLHDGQHVHYLDIGQVFLDGDGNIPQEVMSDGLHPSTEGYRRWAEAVKEPLTRLMQE